MAVQETYTCERDNLFSAGCQIAEIESDSLLIPEGKQYKRGTLLTAEGAMCGDGGTVYAVLAEDIDTTEGAKEAPVYLSGEYNQAYLIAEGEVASLKTSARMAGIYFKESIPA